jgi:RNA polymerase sigma-70 factor (ECF subfamily)
MIAQSDISSSHRLPVVTGTDRASRSAASRCEALHDAGLVRRFNAGDENAFAEIVARYRERMFSVALALLKNRDDAEEIAQDTFIRAHRALATFRGDSSLVTWLHCITVNLARNRYWYFFRRRRHLTLSLDRAVSDDNQATFSDLVASDTATPAREAVLGEFSELIAACMARLTAGQQTILTLRIFSHCSYGEIARELAISVGTVKSRIARARESLRVLLAESCPEFTPDARPAAWFDHVRPAGGLEVICA